MLNSISYAIHDIIHFQDVVFYDIRKNHSFSNSRLQEENEEIIKKEVSFMRKLICHKNFDEFYIENQYEIILMAEPINELNNLIDGTVNIKRDIKELTTRTHSFYKNIKSLAEESKYFKEEWVDCENNCSENDNNTLYLFIEELQFEGNSIGNAIYRNMKKESEYINDTDFNLFTSYRYDNANFNLFTSISGRINSKEFPLFCEISTSTLYKNNMVLIDGMIDFIKSNRPITMSLKDRIYNISKESLTLYEFLKLVEEGVDDGY